MKKCYQVICKTDLYHASHIPGFNRFSGVRIINEFGTLKEANNCIFECFLDDVGSNLTQNLPNWGMACIYGRRTPDISISSIGTDENGYRYYDFDIYRYEVVEKQ